MKRTSSVAIDVTADHTTLDLRVPPQRWLSLALVLLVPAALAWVYLAALSKLVGLYAPSVLATTIGLFWGSYALWIRGRCQRVVIADGKLTVARRRSFRPAVEIPVADIGGFVVADGRVLIQQVSGAQQRLADGLLLAPETLASIAERLNATLEIEPDAVRPPGVAAFQKTPVAVELVSPSRWMGPGIVAMGSALLVAVVFWLSPAVAPASWSLLVIPAALAPLALAAAAAWLAPREAVSTEDGRAVIRRRRGPFDTKRSIPLSEITEVVPSPGGIVIRSDSGRHLLGRGLDLPESSVRWLSMSLDDALVGSQPRPRNTEIDEPREVLHIQLRSSPALRATSAAALTLGLALAAWAAVSVAASLGWVGAIAVGATVASLATLALIRPLLLRDEIRLDRERLEWSRKLGPLRKQTTAATKTVEHFYVELERAAVTVVLASGQKLHLAASHLFANHEALAARLDQHLRSLRDQPNLPSSPDPYR